jgi:cytochrome c peroxidase
MKNIRFFLLSVCTILISAGGVAGSGDLHVWSDSEMKELRDLWLGSLPPLPKDASNIYDDNPRAAELGRKFFFDNRFSGNLKVSCATCHQPDMNFTDILPVAHGIGTSTRRTMPLIGVAYNSWLFWDGRKDSLWSQALGPIENPLEHGFTRTRCAAVIIGHYRKEYEEIFGRMPELSLKDLPPTARPSAEDPAALKKWIFMPRTQQDEVNRIYANMGKAIGAFVRTIVPTESRFDRYIEALRKGDREQAANILSPEELKGLRLFIGKAKCTNCHNGPLFTDGDFLYPSA